MQWLLVACLSLLAADTGQLEERFQKLRREQENFYLPSQLVGLLGETAIQKELKLDERQAAEASKAWQTLADFDRTYRETKDQEQARKLAEEFQKQTVAVAAQVRGLLTKQQLRRANQIMWQGGREFAIGSDRELIKELELSDAQVAKMDQLRAEFETAAQTLSQAQSPPGGFAERLNDARKACETDIAAVLTPEQATKYKELLGPPFDHSGLGRQEQEKR